MNSPLPDPGLHDACLETARACFTQGRHHDALLLLQGAQETGPDDAAAFALAGLCNHALGREHVALADFERSLTLRPGHPETLSNYAITLWKLGRNEEAAQACEAALAVAPGMPEALANLGNARLAQNRTEEALEHYEKALSFKPDDPDLRYNVALTRLALGDYAGGWELFDARLRQPGSPWGAVADKAWNGAPSQPPGRSLLLLAEQGIGDVLQFLRYAPAVAALGYRVYLLVPAALRPLVATQPWCAGLYEEGVSYDECCPLMSLARIFAADPEARPTPAPYLTATEQSRARARGILGEAHRPTIGLAWAGNPRHARDHQRSLQLGALLPFLDRPYTTWVSLHRELSPADKALAMSADKPRDLAGFIDDMALTAGLVAELDLVITVDTSFAHLAGALGKPVWVLLPYAADWRWQRARDDSPWYPSARLFRQERPGDWQGVLLRVQKAIARL